MQWDLKQASAARLRIAWAATDVFYSLTQRRRVAQVFVVMLGIAAMGLAASASADWVLEYEGWLLLAVGLASAAIWPGAVLWRAVRLPAFDRPVRVAIGEDGLTLVYASRQRHFGWEQVLRAAISHRVMVLLFDRCIQAIPVNAFESEQQARECARQVDLAVARAIEASLDGAQAQQPIAAFNPDDLSPLRVARAWLSVRRRLRFGLRAFQATLVGVALAVALRIAPPANGWGVLVITLAVTVVVLESGFLLPIAFARWIGTHQPGDGVGSVTLQEQGIRFAGRTGQVLIPWSQLRRVGRAHGVVMLIKRSGYEPIPVGAFESTEAADAFIESINARLNQSAPEPTRT